jgi:hypothetical protein
MKKYIFRFWDGDMMIHSGIEERPHGDGCGYDETNWHYFPHNSESWIFCIKEPSDNILEVNERYGTHIPMLYIGENDKNDNMIFEGDILEWKFNKMKKERCVVNDIRRIPEIPSIAVIVGNIYENPDKLSEPLE